MTEKNAYNKPKLEELKDTVNLMTSKNYWDRLQAEYLQINIRIEKLENMLIKYKEGKLGFQPHCSYELLHEQLVYMKQYERILTERMCIEMPELYE